MRKPLVPKRFMRENSKSIKINEDLTMELAMKKHQKKSSKDVENDVVDLDKLLHHKTSLTEQEELFCKLKDDIRKIISEELEQKFLHFSSPHLPTTEAQFNPFFNKKKFKHEESKCSLNSDGTFSLNINHKHPLDEEPVLYIFGNNYVILPREEKGTEYSILNLEVKIGTDEDIKLKGVLKRLKNGVFVISEITFHTINGDIINFNDLVPFEMKLHTKLCF